MTRDNELKYLDRFIWNNNGGGPISGGVSDEKVTVNRGRNILEFHWPSILKFKVGFVLKQSGKLRG